MPGSLLPAQLFQTNSIIAMPMHRVHPSAASATEIIARQRGAIRSEAARGRRTRGTNEPRPRARRDWPTRCVAGRAANPRPARDGEREPSGVLLGIAAAEHRVGEQCGHVVPSRRMVDGCFPFVHRSKML